MIIENFTDDILVFKSHGRKLELKPGINTVEAALVDVEALERHFGHYIHVYRVNSSVVEVLEDEQDTIKDDNTPATDDDNKDIPAGEEPGADEPADTVTGETDGVAPDTGDGEGDKADGEVQTETPEDEPTEKTAQKDEEEQVSEKTEPTEAETKVEDMKRPELMTKAKELGLEVKPSMKNVDLVDLIKKAQK